MLMLFEEVVVRHLAVRIYIIFQEKEHSKMNQEDLTAKEEDSSSEGGPLLIDETKDFLFESESNDVIPKAGADVDWLYCMVCGKSFNNDNKPAFHQHCGEHFVKCDGCCTIFDSSDLLAAHQKDCSSLQPPTATPTVG